MSYDPIQVTHAGDELNRGIAIINTVLLALDSANTDHDIEQARDTLYEAHLKLVAAQNFIGLYHPPEGE